jgi:hypothetical protein
MIQRGLSVAVDYLKAFKPLRLVPDAIYKRCGATGLVSSLGHSLRREARKPDNTNRVNVSYSPDGLGRDVAFYTYNTDYKAPDRPVKAPCMLFFTGRHTSIPSPLFITLEALKTDIHYTKDCRIWMGTHQSPILLEVK